MSTNPTNPYVGPRTFTKEEGHLFYGRDREARDLLSMIGSEQLVLFYAQSGAGKSSLINTRVIPTLEARNYEVLRVGRVSGEGDPGVQVENIYIFNLLRSLTHQDVPGRDLAELHLDQFLAGLQKNEKGYFYEKSPSKPDDDKPKQRRALIIDQFEEIFSTHPEAWQKREDFFEQIAQAMQSDPYLWVVLVMREDYIANLDPYSGLLPNGLRVRYYMQRLGREAAIKAVKSPAEKLRPYEEGVAEKLVDDLSRIKYQKPDGTPDFQLGQYVEPVQLQVVCYGLWQNLMPGGSTITEKDLEDVGDVDEALGKYYASRIAGVAEAKHVKERLLRNWIEKKLIAPGGIRSMVMQERRAGSGEISDDVIHALQSDLVRAENRGGTIWYELTHDRLVGPILESNKKWFDENLSPLQRQATLWNDQERNESWLLRDQALEEVEKWAQENPDELTDLENDFLEACRKQQAERQLNEQVRSAQRLRRFVTVVGALGIIAVVAAAVAIVASITATNQAAIALRAKAEAEEQTELAQIAEAEAEKQKEIAIEQQVIAEQERERAEESADQALAGNLVAQADSLKNSNYPLSLLLGIEAFARDPNLLTRTTLFRLLQFTPYTRHFNFTGPVSSIAVSPDGQWVAVASCGTGKADRCTEGGIRIFKAEDMEEIQHLDVSDADFGIVYSLAFHQYQDPDRLVLAAGGCVPAGCSSNRGQITLWDLTDSQNPVLLDDTKGMNRPEFTHRALVKTIAFSPSGEFLASGSYDTTIILWKVDQQSELSPVTRFEGREGHFSFVNSVVFSPDGNILISAGDDRSIKLWDIRRPEKRLQNYANLPAPVNSIAFSPDGDKFASAGDDNVVLLWDWVAVSGRLQNPEELKGHFGYVRSVAFNGDGTVLASAGFDNRIILWDRETGQQIGSPLIVHDGAINSVAFGTPDVGGDSLPYLMSGSDDRTVVQWDLFARQPLSYTMDSEADSSQEQLTALSVQFSATGIGQQVEVTSAQSGEEFLTLDGFDSPVHYVELQESNLLTMEQTQIGSGRITTWNLDPSQWVERACTAVTQNLTDTALQQLLDQFKKNLPPGEPSLQKCIPDNS